MKAIATSQFQEKWNALEDNFKYPLANFFTKIKHATLLVNKKVSPDDLIIESNIIVHSEGALRVFYTIESEPNGSSVVLLLDLLVKAPPPRGVQFKNPALNSHINPNLNPQINPNLNPQINPNLNPRINPNLNSQINPNLNSQINPNLNLRFKGLYFFDFSLHPVEFLIPADDNVLIFFGFDFLNTKFGVKHSGDGFVIFNRFNNEWIGHLESDSSEGFNYFDLSNKWVGFIR